MDGLESDAHMRHPDSEVNPIPSAGISSFRKPSSANSMIKPIQNFT